MRLHAIVATHGRPRLLQRLLESVAEADLPESFGSVLVVENGGREGAEALCDRMRSRLPLEYRWSAPPSKAAAMNLGVASVEADDLVVMFDDDIRVAPETFVAYDAAMRERPAGYFFGGPMDVDQDTPPPEWLVRYLPGSATGWRPDPERFDPTRNRFYGCNVAAFARDIRSVGGYDAKLGPGTGASGDDMDLQRRLHQHGLRSQLVVDAVVSHYVPEERCNARWALMRACEMGAERGTYMRSRGWGHIVLNHALNAGRWTVGRTAALFGAAGVEPKTFPLARDRARAAGYFEGYYGKRGVSRAAA